METLVYSREITFRNKIIYYTVYYKKLKIES